MNNKLQEILNSKTPSQRAVTLDLKKIDEEKRTVEVAFSSDVEVERTFGIEVLDHSRGAVDLSLLNDGAPLLDGHDWDKQIGVVERAWVDPDGKGRAVVRFSRNAHADEIFKDVVDGIRTKISVGYWIEDAEMVGERDSGEPVYNMKWKPYEISFVSVPADNTVGVGRGLEIHPHKDKDEDDMPKDEKKLPEEKPEAPTEERELPEEEKEEREPESDKPKDTESSEDEEPKASERAPEVPPKDDEDKETEAERSESKSEEPQKPENTAERSAPAVHTSEKENEMDMPIIDTTPLEQAERSERREYNIMTAIRSLTGEKVDAGFEIEVSQELAKKEGGDVRGIKVPAEVLARNLMVGQREMTKGGTGGNLVEMTHRGDMYIEVLREATLAGRLGATMLNGLVGDVHIPKQTSKQSFGWIDESGNAPVSDFNLGNVRMNPKTVAGQINMSRRLMLQSDPSIQSLVSREILKGIAETADDAVFTGTGLNNQPTGIWNQTGVNEVTIATDGEPTFDETVAFITALLEDNVNVDGATYIVTPAVQQHLMTTSKDSGSGFMLMENGMMNGHRVIATNKNPTNGIMMGNFQDILIGAWSSIDLQIDPYSAGQSGGLIMRAFQDLDVAIRRGESFAKGV